jgi:hypothetical protein
MDVYRYILVYRCIYISNKYQWPEGVLQSLVILVVPKYLHLKTFVLTETKFKTWLDYINFFQQIVVLQNKYLARWGLH